MSRGKEIWNTKENAEAYDKYARSFPMYKDTSRDLIKISGVKSGMTIIDLAAGTGATTQAIFDQIGDDVYVIAIDQAEEMLTKAREKFINKNVKFIVSEAEDLDKVITEPVDAVLCNSALWQMKGGQVFKAVSGILKPNGIFAFNLPDSFFNEKDAAGNIELWAKEAGLTLVNKSIELYDKSLDEILAFNEIPVMKRNFKTEEDRQDFINKLKDELTAGLLNKRQWVYFIFKKRGP